MPAAATPAGSHIVLLVLWHFVHRQALNWGSFIGGTRWQSRPTFTILFAVWACQTELSVRGKVDRNNRCWSHGSASEFGCYLSIYLYEPSLKIITNCECSGSPLYPLIEREKQIVLAVVTDCRRACSAGAGGGLRGRRLPRPHLVREVDALRLRHGVRVAWTTCAQKTRRTMKIMLQVQKIAS